MEHIKQYFDGNYSYNDTLDVAECLMQLCGFDWIEEWKNDGYQEALKQLELALFHLKCVAENKHNAECFRYLWAVLNVIRDRVPQELPF